MEAWPPRVHIQVSFMTSLLGSSCRKLVLFLKGSASFVDKMIKDKFKVNTYHTTLISYISYLVLQSN